MYLLEEINQIVIVNLKTDKNSNSPPQNMSIEFDKEKRLPDLLKGSKLVREYFKNIK